jgi:hypothetical protein
LNGQVPMQHYLQYNLVYNTKEASTRFTGTASISTWVLSMGRISPYLDHGNLQTSKTTMHSSQFLQTPCQTFLPRSSMLACCQYRRNDRCGPIVQMIGNTSLVTTEIEITQDVGCLETSSVPKGQHCYTLLIQMGYNYQ